MDRGGRRRRRRRRGRGGRGGAEGATPGRDEGRMPLNASERREQAATEDDGGEPEARDDRKGAESERGQGEREPNEAMGEGMGEGGGPLGEPGMPGEGMPGEGGRRRRRRRRRRGRGGQPEGVMPEGQGERGPLDEAEGESADDRAADQPGQRRQDSSRPASMPEDEFAPRGDSWDLEPNLLPAMPTRGEQVGRESMRGRPALAGGAPAKDQARSNAARVSRATETDAESAGDEPADSMGLENEQMPIEDGPESALGSGVAAEGGEGEAGDGRRRRRRRRGRGRGGAGSGPVGDGPRPAERQPTRGESARPPMDRPVQDRARGSGAGGGDRRSSVPSREGRGSAAERSGGQGSRAPAPKTSNPAGASAPKFLYSSRRKLTPGEVPKQRRD
jgi:hypothetical protein